MRTLTYEEMLRGILTFLVWCVGVFLCIKFGHRDLAAMHPARLVGYLIGVSIRVGLIIWLVRDWRW